MTVLVASTLAAYAMDDPGVWGSWCSNAEAVRERAEEQDYDVEFFAAVETDARGLDPFLRLFERLGYVGGTIYDFHLNDARDRVTTENRLRHIVTGQNIVSTYATEDKTISHLLFCAADCRPPDDVIPRLLETGHPYIGPRIDTYGAVCRGPKFDPRLAGPWPDEWGMEDAMPSAACMMLARRVFTRLRWRVEAPNSDDPCYQLDARELLGIRSAVRTDIRAIHYPEAIGAVETRGHDLRVRR